MVTVTILWISIYPKSSSDGCSPQSGVEGQLSSTHTYIYTRTVQLRIISLYLGVKCRQVQDNGCSYASHSFNLLRFHAIYTIDHLVSPTSGLCFVSDRYWTS